MSIRVRYFITHDQSRYKNQFARWQIDKEWLVGLKAWEGQPFMGTERYKLFCEDDTLFVQQALDGRHPANPKQIQLGELLLRFLEWIQTPLKHQRLVEHLLEMTGTAFIANLNSISLQDVEDLPTSGLSDDFSYDVEDLSISGLSDEVACLYWDRCWKVICEAPKNSRTVFLLSQRPEFLVVLTAQADPCPTLAPMLGLSLEEMRKLFPQLPLEDKEIARRHGITVNYVQQMRFRCRERLRRRVGRPHV